MAGLASVQFSELFVDHDRLVQHCPETTLINFSRGVKPHPIDLLALSLFQETVFVGEQIPVTESEEDS